MSKTVREIVMETVREIVKETMRNTLKETVKKTVRRLVKEMERKLLVPLWMRKETISVDHELKYFEVVKISVRILYITRLTTIQIKGTKVVAVLNQILLLI